ncbi:CGNR zinc finger domain-containing protein [Fodinicola acaciae]|uniref:CGNR zinc finger domain-containing protein n=1 Tax=Fodinicola acaciae TaxID=2681555 RepID=UPI0013D4D2E9|nr:CGNR zinc finger domain-containing protein [Fodinicola acaciae]
MSSVDRVVTSGSSPLHAARRAADFVGAFRGQPTADELVALLETHGEVGPISLSDKDIDELRDASVRLARIFRSATVDEAAGVLNDLFAGHAGPPRLTAHGNTGWHIHIDADDDDGPWGRWLITSSAWGLAVLLADHQALPGGVCAAPDCERPYVNAGNGSPRRFCSSRCATRVRVAAHRRRS